MDKYVGCSAHPPRVSQTITIQSMAAKGRNTSQEVTTVVNQLATKPIDP